MQSVKFLVFFSYHFNILQVKEDLIHNKSRMNVHREPSVPLCESAPHKNIIPKYKNYNYMEKKLL